MITAIQDRSGLTLADLKSFLKIEHAAEDAFLTTCLTAAKQQADLFCQNEFLNDDGSAAAIPSDVNIAIMKIASTLYQKRDDHIADESIAGYNYSTGSISWDARTMLFPHRKIFTV